MNETQKPFACSEKDCEMTFTNEDHLNWHQKKHDMILNLGIAKNDVADQTPTPTRFIRNCEEVGLFQDLQNVNPFEEFFKKAVESVKNGETLEVPEANSDDTLHTPHILPHVEENQKKNNVNNNQDDNNSRSNEFSLNSVIPIENVCTNENDEKQCDITPVIVIDDESDNEKDIKQRIKEALQNKGKQRIEKDTSTTSNNVMSVVPFQNLTVKEREKHKTTLEKSGNAVVDDSREKIREMNRAAQIRCRKRKQIRWKEMEEEILILKDENKRLKFENYSLQRQLLEMKKTADNSKVPLTPTAVPTLPQILPKLNGTSNPIVIQILPGVSNAAASITDNSLSNVEIENVCGTSSPLGPSNDCAKKNIKKSLRKIIPKIIIEN